MSLVKVIKQTISCQSQWPVSGLHSFNQLAASDIGPPSFFFTQPPQQVLIPSTATLLYLSSLRFHQDLKWSHLLLCMFVSWLHPLCLKRKFLAHHRHSINMLSDWHLAFSCDRSKTKAQRSKATCLRLHSDWPRQDLNSRPHNMKPTLGTIKPWKGSLSLNVQESWVGKL